MNSRVLNGFDMIAPLYDGLSGFVFRNSIRNAQLNFLEEIPKEGNVLILGGGTGWLLSEFLNLNPHCCVWYIEASQKMLEITRKKVVIPPTICLHYIHGTEADIPPEVRFNAIITNFYFDLFSCSSLYGVLQHVAKKILPDGVLLVSDFIRNNVWWQRLLLTIMYRFFRATCGIESTHLPDWENQLKNFGFKEGKSTLFYDGFIKSAVYSL